MRCSHVFRRGTRCERNATPHREDGLCHSCRKNTNPSSPAEKEKDRLAKKKRREELFAASGGTITACTRCGAEKHTDKIRGGLCGVCRQVERRPDPPPPPIPEHRLCSVAGCTRAREYQRTCLDHSVRFDAAPKSRRPRAEDFAIRRIALTDVVL